MSKFWFISLIAFLIIAICDGWSPLASVVVLLNGLIVLLNVIVRLAHISGSKEA